MSAAPCDREVFEKGHSVAMLDAWSADAEEWVQAVARESGQRVDWHYSGGVANVLFIGDPARVLAAVRSLAPTLRGRIMRTFDVAGEHGPHRAGDDLPPGVIAVATL